MLSIAKLRDVEYYLDCVAADAAAYYAGEGEQPGRWLGRAAQASGLAGEVDPDRLRALFSADHAPDGSEKTLTVVGYDLTISAPKSVTLLWAFGTEEVRSTVSEAHDRAVDAVLAMAEREACLVRRGHAGERLEEGRGYIAAAFRHRASRANDPHLHTHLLVCARVEGADGRWSALDGRQLYSWARPLGVVYQAVLRDHLANLGLEWTLHANGYGEVAGVEGQLVRSFSKRRLAIEDEATRRGASSARGLDRAQKSTRPAKDRERAAAGDDVLRSEWREQLESTAIQIGQGSHRSHRLARVDDVTQAIGRGRRLEDHEVEATLREMTELAFVPSPRIEDEDRIERQAPAIADLRRRSTFFRRDVYAALAASVPHASVAQLDRAVEAMVLRADCIELSAATWDELGAAGVPAGSSGSRFRWSGAGAAALGLMGHVDVADWMAVCSGSSPVDAESNEPRRLVEIDPERAVRVVELRPHGALAEAWRVADDVERTRLSAMHDRAVADAVAAAEESVGGGLVAAVSERTSGRDARLDARVALTAVVGRADGWAILGDDAAVEALRREYRAALVRHSRALGIPCQTRTSVAGLGASEARLAIDRGSAERIRTRRDRVVVAGRGERRYATAEMLRIESETLEWALRGLDARVALVPSEVAERAVAATEAASGISLTVEQRAMVDVLVGGGHRVVVVVGVAGSGKTTALRTSRQAWEEAGIPVVGCATQGKTAQLLASETGIGSRTVARLVRERDGLPRGAVVVLDEAAMTSSRDLALLAAMVDQAAGKLVLVGDPRQLPPVDTAGLMRSLATRLLLMHSDALVQLRTNRRQIEGWERQAVAWLRMPRGGDDRFGQGVVSYLEHGSFHAFADASAAAKAMVERWWTECEAGHTVLMVTGTNAHREAINALARSRLRAKGRLGAEVEIADRYWAVGDRIVTMAPGRHARTRWVNGETGTVMAVRDGRRAHLVVQLDSGRQVTVGADRVRDGEVAHAYAVTAHKAQGTTVDLCLLFGSDAYARELLYSALTRGRHNELYVPLAGLTQGRDEGSHQAERPDLSVEALRAADLLLALPEWAGADRVVVASEVQALLDAWSVSDLEHPSADFALRAEGIGKLVETCPPMWVRAWVGAPPADPEGRRAWRVVVGEATAWRQRWGLLDDTRPGVPDAPDVGASAERTALMWRIRGELAELGVVDDREQVRSVELEDAISLEVS